jgi:hypothetical protein
MQTLARHFLVLAALLLALCPAGAQENRALRVALVLDLAVYGDLGGSEFEARHAERAPAVSDRLRAQLQDAGLFNVLSSPQVVARLREAQQTLHLHRCNGCELDLGRSLGADVVVVPWIYRVSNLILTLHCEVRDVRTGAVLFKRALDFRGDNDRAWDRAIRFLVAELRESRPR